MSDKQNASSFPRITEKALDDLRKRIGVRIDPEPEPWCYEATRDNIRHYAHGIGDDNPLWCVPDYARTTKWGDVVALPSFLFACSRIASGYVGGLAGIHAMFAGTNWTWHRYAARNDVIVTESYLKDLVLHETQFAGTAVQQIYHVDYFNSEGDRLAEVDSWVFRTERDTAREQGRKYESDSANTEHRFTDAELREIGEYYAKEEIRGAEPRYYEDVAIGEKLPVTVKGPMTITGFIAYAQGWGGLYIRAHKLAWKQQLSHPFLGIPNRFNIPDCPERVHWERELAQRVGAPGAYDYGPERCSWLTHQLTNWIGDDGFLVSSNTKIRRHNLEGEVLFIHGTVTGKTVGDDGRHRVEIEQHAVNFHDEESIVGTAVVALPSRA